MKIQYIAYSMTFILLALFIGVSFFRPREEKKMHAEALYSDLLLQLQKDPKNQELYKKCEEAALEYGKIRGLDQEKSKAFMNKDLQLQ